MSGARLDCPRRPAGHASRPDNVVMPVRPSGVVTRGTTCANRLRRVDRWLTATHGGLLRAALAAPVVVDLGFGSSPVTTLELARRIHDERADAQIVGLEIDPSRVATAQRWARPGVGFRRGGFELELDLDGRTPTLVRAFNVLRQYDPDAAAAAWREMCRRLGNGLLVEGTCDELGRRATWVTLDAHGPRTLTLATHVPSLDRPSSLAARLPKSLIHHNVAGQPVAALLVALDRGWDEAAAYAPFGQRQRWMRAVASVRDAGWDVRDREPRWRLGEITVGWAAVAPVVRS